MARRASEIAIQFKRPPGILFSEGDKFDVAANTLVIQIQPDEGVTLVMNSKIPGLETRTQPVKMHFRYATTFGSNTPEAYERLILDAMVAMERCLLIRNRSFLETCHAFTEHQNVERMVWPATRPALGPVESERLSMATSGDVRVS